MVKYYLKDSFMHNAHEKNAGRRETMQKQSLFLQAIRD